MRVCQLPCFFAVLIQLVNHRIELVNGMLFTEELAILLQATLLPIDLNIRQSHTLISPAAPARFKAFQFSNKATQQSTPAETRSKTFTDTVSRITCKNGGAGHSLLP